MRIIRNNLLVCRDADLIQSLFGTSAIDFRTIKQAISYCRLCGAEKSSADKVMRTPITASAANVSGFLLTSLSKARRNNFTSLRPNLSPEALPIKAIGNTGPCWILSARTPVNQAGAGFRPAAPKIGDKLVFED